MGTGAPARLRPLTAVGTALLAMIASNVVHTGGFPLPSLLGFALIAAVVLAGLGLKRLTRLPAVAGTSVLAIALTSPI
ncbi:hypothetical protein ABT324_19075 [Saccharopolyspora sp. NPDC000359]|uniref:hypothetical protein n=1 Tax=Saccharopolyspora sp. NPDC000359 TaxID=3154251 RepID=UPI00332F8020